jgi:carbon-monoxide dehydrogenase medium subunit
VQLLSKLGERVVPLDGFFSDYYETVMAPNEVLAEIRIPVIGPRTAAHFVKFLPRTADDYATVSVGVRLTLDESERHCEDVRIVLGACGATAVRARRAESVLRGGSLSESTFREAAAVARTEVDPISDVRGSAAYKTDMAEVFVRRTLSRVREKLAVRK